LLAVEQTQAQELGWKQQRSTRMAALAYSISKAGFASVDIDWDKSPGFSMFLVGLSLMV
jgi:hypothetical protein